MINLKQRFHLLKVNLLYTRYIPKVKLEPIAVFSGCDTEKNCVKCGYATKLSGFIAMHALGYNLPCFTKVHKIYFFEDFDIEKLTHNQILLSSKLIFYVESNIKVL
jgi:hypothetical protein